MDWGHGRLGFLRVKEAQGQSHESLQISKTVTELFDIFYCAMCVSERCGCAIWGLRREKQTTLAFDLRIEGQGTSPPPLHHHPPECTTMSVNIHAFFLLEADHVVFISPALRKQVKC